MAAIICASRKMSDSTVLGYCCQMSALNLGNLQCEMEGERQENGKLILQVQLGTHWWQKYDDGDDDDGNDDDDGGGGGSGSDHGGDQVKIKWKIDDEKTSFLLGLPIFRKFCLFNFRGGAIYKSAMVGGTVWVGGTSPQSYHGVFHLENGPQPGAVKLMASKPGARGHEKKKALLSIILVE